MIVIKAIFLDLDGTLINSEKAFSECFIDVLNNKYKANVTKEDYKKYELEQSAMLIDYVRRTSPVLENVSDKDIMSLVYNNYVEYFRNIIREREAISNFEIIRELKSQGYILALVTTCRRYYLDILEKFWNKVIYDGNNIVLKKWNNYVWNYDFYFPSFSWTSIAITLASSIESKTTLNNISIEPEILFQIETLKKCGVTINFLAERSIEIQWIDFSKMKNQLLIKIPEDRNVLITKLILAIITNTEFYYKSDYDLHLSSLLLELEKMWINYVYDKYSIKINRIHKQLKPINILANFYPGICSDWQPFIALVLILISWRSIIKDSVFENRYKYIKEISKIIPKFSYDILWNSLEIIWLVKNKKWVS